MKKLNKDSKQMLFEMIHKVSGMPLNESNIYRNRHGIITIDKPIIPDAITILSNNKNAIKFTDKNEFESFLNTQKYFSASYSHCYYSVDDYEDSRKGGERWRRDYTGISEADRGCVLLFETGHEPVAIWDEMNKIGYILPKEFTDK